LVSSSRWDALDFFRFAAVMLMVQGHAFYVLVDEAIRAETWYRWHNYVHGYTAPTFMFASGLAFGVTTFRRWDDHARWGKPLLRRLERYLMIIGLGYLIHLPSFSMAALDGASDQALANFLKVDALQVIGITLLVCELLVVALKKRGAFVTIVSALGLAAVFLAPFVHRLVVEDSLHPALAAYVNSNTGSPFPVFPWAAFLCAGIVAAYFVQKTFDDGAKERLTGRLVAVAGALMVAAGLLGTFDPGLFGEHNLWKTGPWFFFWRVGVLLLFLALLSVLADLLSRRGPKGPVHETVRVMAMETLVIYVAHLFILYGTPINQGMNRFLGKELGIAHASLFVAILFAAMTALAWGWHLFKKKKPTQFFWARMAMLAVLLGWVFLSP
jgi:hypothetical protein